MLLFDRCRFLTVRRISLSWNFKVLQWINLNESFRHYYIHYEDYVTRFKKNSFESFQRYTKKRKKSKFWMKLHLYRWWENGLVFKIARTKINQNFLALKYDISGASTRETEPHTHRIWSTSFSLDVTWLTEHTYIVRTYIRTRLQIVRVG